MPTVVLWAVFIYIEALVRLKEVKNVPFHMDLCRPFAAHWSVTWLHNVIIILTPSLKFVNSINTTNYLSLHPQIICVVLPQNCILFSVCVFQYCRF